MRHGISAQVKAPAHGLRNQRQGLSRLERRRAVWGFVFIAPTLIGFVVFLLGPIIASLFLSFTEWDLVNPPRFIGLENYTERMVQDQQFWVSLKNTVWFAVMSIPLSIVVALGLGLAISRAIVGVTLFRIAFFIPVISSMVAVGMVWRWIYNTEFGILNYALNLVGIPPQPWLTSEHLVLPALVLVSVWKSMGYNMILFLAGLKAIPPHLYEAAEIDGATTFQRFRYITLPLLTPTTFFITVMSVIASFQVYDQVYVMTQGGPGDASRVYYYWLWQNAFQFFRMGYASAMAWVLFAILFVLTLIQMRTFGRRVQYEQG